MIAQIDRDMIKMRPLSVWRRLTSYVLFEGRPLTTRGRWINPLLFAQFRLAGKLPQFKRIRRPVFILGTGRSGTTILGKLFHMHAECGFLNEPKALWHAVYPEEDVIGSYSRERASYRLDETAVTGNVRQKAQRLYGYYRLLTGAERVVDKYPEMIFRVPFLRAIFPDAKLVFLVRNGMDTLRSIAFWSERHGGRAGNESHDWWGADQRKWRLLVDQVVAGDDLLSPLLDRIRTVDRQTDMAAVEWIVTMREGMHWLNRLPEAVCRVRYEDLVADPDTTLTALLDFCELPMDATMLAYARTVLSPPSDGPDVALHPALAVPFYQTMERLGYSFRPEEDGSG